MDAPAHEHEAWMLEESATGGTYCRACGQPVDEAIAPEGAA